MRDKKILKIVWRKSIASLHRLTQVVQRANLIRTAGDPTWVFGIRLIQRIDQKSAYCCHFHYHLPNLVNIVKERTSCLVCYLLLYQIHSDQWVQVISWFWRQKTCIYLWMLCTTAARTHRDDCFKPICLGQKAVYNYELWLGLRPKKETKNKNEWCVYWYLNDT